MNNLIQAVAFAAERHKNQKRKGIGRIPYINHPVKVAALLTKFGENDPDLIISAFLHDVIEDTANGEDEIKELSDILLDRFGEKVLLTVLEVSDNKSLSVDERKRLQVINTPNLSDNAKKLKIADKICNMLDIMNDPPLHWNRKRKIKYIEWAREVVEGARGLNPKLDQYFDKAYIEVYENLLER